jgi:pyruvate dehydrogenase E2 component (dihydrolipoamide acetyltransferase)
MAMEFRLPELGENITTAVVAKILVSVGDTVAQDQPVLELETDKAVVEIPAPAAGVVKEIYVKEGDKAEVGQLILMIAESDGAKQVKEEKKKEEAAPTKYEKKEEEKEEEKEPVWREPAAPKERQAEVIEFIPPPRTVAQSEVARKLVPAAPSVRRFARELGVDISQVPGSGPAGRISIEDVKKYARQIMTSGKVLALAAGAQPVAPLPDFTRWGEVERKPMSSVRRKTAEQMGYAWTSVPHVTQFDKADITDLEQLRKDFAKKAEATGGKLTVTAILLKVVASALKVFPQFNASIDMTKNEVIYKKYYHIGVAVDTDRGLLVPVIRDADQKNILELSAELTQMAERARNKKITLEEMQGATFTITNLGGIGGTYFSPIVNTPEVAILGISRASMEPVWVNGQFEPHLMLPLSLSYDHRIIDGADAARFLRWVVEALQQPFLLALEG